MKIASHIPASALAKLALGLAVLAAASGIAFASWVDKGAAIFMAMAETGLAWCF
ncbi:hypothetical protein [Mesorhizobium sp. 1B3]|uniref:hypothetical protein n=1 Tax=Mesorhizobium sp. 1B3 TaxID=3243599 RepID=UPI003D963271